MDQPPDHPAPPAVPPPAPNTVAQWLFRIFFIAIPLATAMVLAFWAGQMVLRRPKPLMSRIALAIAPVGTYRTVREVSGALVVRMKDGLRVRLGGAAVPEDPAAAARAAARLGDLIPPGTVVYVEIEPRAAGAPTPAPASVFLPPPGAKPVRPFPYEKSQLLGAVLVQEGLVRVRTDEPYRYRNELLGLEDDARRHARGLWAAP